MANSDNLQRLIVYLTAAVLAIGTIILAVYVYLQPTDPSKDFTLIFGFLGTAFGSASTFLFLGESRTAQTKAITRAHEAGGALGLSVPQTSSGPDAFEDVYDPAGDVPDAEDTTLIDPDVPAEHRDAVPATTMTTSTNPPTTTSP